jgi:RNA polymerase sigma-70 factor, ECF subfamily
MISPGMARSDPSWPRGARGRAFATLYAAHFGLVWSVVRRMGVDDGAREDVVQDAWIAIYRNADRLRESASARAFVVAFARNVALHHHRARGRRERKHDALAQLEPGGPDARATVEARDAVEALLASMNEEQALVFVLVHAHGLTGREIASALGENVNTVHSRLRLARRHAEAFAAQQRIEEATLSSRVAQDEPDEAVRRRIALAIAAKLPATATTVGSLGVFAATVIVGAVGLGVVAVVLPEPEPRHAPTIAHAIEPRETTRSEPARTDAPPAVPHVEPTVASVTEAAEPSKRAPSSGAPKPERAPIDDASELEREAEILRGAKTALDAGDPHQALQRLDAHAQSFPHGRLEDVRRGLRVRALCAAGKVAQARGEAAALAADRPDSAVAAGTRDTCGDVTASPR